MIKLYEQVTTKLKTRQSSNLLNIPKYGKFAVAELEQVIMLVNQDLPLNHVPNQDPLYKLYLALMYEVYTTEGYLRNTKPKGGT